MNSEQDVKAEHVFSWKLQNFEACSLKNGCFFSPVFMADSLDETTWCMQIYPRGNYTEEYISCFLKRSLDCAGPDEVECDYTIEIEAIDYNKSLVKHQFVNKFKKGVAFGMRNFIKKDSIMKINAYSCDFTVKVTMRKKVPKLFSNNMCLTKFVTDQFSFKRNVKNSTRYSDVKPFSFTESTKFELKIGLLADDVLISIRRIKGFQESQTLLSSVILMDLEGNEVESKEAIFESDDPSENDTWTFPNFLKKSKISAEKDKYLKEEYFTLKFNFSLSSGKTLDSINDLDCSSSNYSLTTAKDFSASLKTDLKHVFANNVHTDVELHAEKKVFRAHKVILCARSPVFLAMFNQNMAEKQSGVINISDIKAETLNSLLEFMYTGDTEILNYESALKLLLASDRYQIQSLKEKCSSALELLLSDENVCDVLFTADLVQQDSLKVSAVNHIKENFKIVFKSDKWKELLKKNLILATETFCEVSTL